MKPANDNPKHNWSGLWMKCSCGSKVYGVKLDEQTGLKHIICEGCGADRSMDALS